MSRRIITLGIWMLGGMAAGWGVPSLSAQATADPAFSLTATSLWVSQYMFRGQRYGGQSLQPYVEADCGEFAAGVATSFPLAGQVAGQSDPEIDYYGSFMTPFGHEASLGAGFTVYTYPRAPQGATAAPYAGRRRFFRSTFEPNLAVNYTFQGVRFTPKAYYDLTSQGLTLEMNAVFAVPLRSVGTEMDFTGTYGAYSANNSANVRGTDLPPVRAAGQYWLVGISLPYQLGRYAKATVGVAYSGGFGAYTQPRGGPRLANPAATGRAVISVSVAHTF